MASQVISVDIPPGYVKVDSPLTERGRYTDGIGVRFFKKKAQKVGGFVHLLAAALSGIVRGLKAWNDLSSQQLIAAGTTERLYAISDRNFTPVDITPFVKIISPDRPVHDDGRKQSRQCSLPRPSGNRWPSSLRPGSNHSRRHRRRHPPRRLLFHHGNRR
jgi:hypothetical protein